MESEINYEQRSLSAAKRANLGMAAVGLLVGYVANSDAVILDGLFSGLNFFSAVIASYVATSVRRSPDANRPLGYEIDESLFLMFRGLVLTGIIAMAIFSAINRIVEYWLTGAAEEVGLAWITVYASFMTVACFSLTFYHYLNWRRGGRKSEIVVTESKSAFIDGMLSAGAGIAFVSISFLTEGPLEFIVPISDSVVVLLLCLCMIPQPIMIFLRALREVVGVSLPAKEAAKIEAQARELLLKSPFEVLSAAALKVGRINYYLVYLRPADAVTIDEIEAARKKLLDAAEPSYVEVILVNTPPF